MRLWVLPVLFAAAVAAGLVIFLPLSAALAWAGAERYGLTAQTVRGTVWAGELTGVRAGGVAFDQVSAGLDPLALLGGGVRLHLQSGAGRAIVVGGARRGLENATLPLAAAQLGLNLPAGAIMLQDASLVFDAEGCRLASGQVTADMLEREFGGPVLAGDLACEGRNAQVLLTSPDGGASAQVTLGPDGQVSLLTRLTGDPAVQSAAALAGFQREGDAVVRLDSGRLGT